MTHERPDYQSSKSDLDTKPQYRVRSNRSKDLTDRKGPDFNFSVAQNLHRWKFALDERLRGVLEEAVRTLQWAWKTDMKYRTSYPMNTNYAFGEIKREIKQGSKPRVERQVSALRTQF